MLWAYGFSQHVGNMPPCRRGISPSRIISEHSSLYLLRVSHYCHQITWKTGFQLHLKCIKEIEILKNEQMPGGCFRAVGFRIILTRF